MFLVGVFSTHITYIILALVYIFGYGTYALNQKKQTAEIEEYAKIISVGNDCSIENNSTNYYFEYSFMDCEKKEIQSVKINHPDYPLKVKLKPFENNEWTSYNSSLPNITRPSPVLS